MTTATDHATITRNLPEPASGSWHFSPFPDAGRYCDPIDLDWHARGSIAMRNAGAFEMRMSDDIADWLGAVARARRQHTPGICTDAHDYEPIGRVPVGNGVESATDTRAFPHDIRYRCQSCGTLDQVSEGMPIVPDPDPNGIVHADRKTVRWLMRNLDTLELYIAHG